MYGENNQKDIGLFTALEGKFINQFKTSNITNSTHSPFIDNPDMFYDEVTKFIDDNCCNKLNKLFQYISMLLLKSIKL